MAHPVCHPRTHSQPMKKERGFCTDLGLNSETQWYCPPMRKHQSGMPIIGANLFIIIPEPETQCVSGKVLDNNCVNTIDVLRNSELARTAGWTGAIGGDLPAVGAMEAISAMDTMTRVKPTATARYIQISPAVPPLPKPKATVLSYHNLNQLTNMYTFSQDQGGVKQVRTLVELPRYS